MTDGEILILVDKLESCQLPKTDFHHRDHLTVAVVYLMNADLESAVSRMRVTLKHFATHHGVGALYHETLTRFWFQQVEKYLCRTLSLHAAVEKVHSELSDKQLPLRYYSKERLDSEEARQRYIEPDIASPRSETKLAHSSGPVTHPSLSPLD